MSNAFYLIRQHLFEFPLTGSFSFKSPDSKEQEYPLLHITNFLKKRTDSCLSHSTSATSPSATAFCAPSMRLS
jgi:hypothetical protein